MTPSETASTLRQFNEWRRGDYEPSEQPEPPNPYEVGLAIDAAVEMMDEIERLRAELATEQRLSFRDQIAGLETEVERLRTQNAILMDAINAASALMASAPVQKENEMIDINELRKLAQAATPGPWIAKNASGAGLEIYMSHPVYPDKDWPAFGTDSAFCKKGLVSYETWTQFPHEVHDAQQSINARFIAAANPAVILELLDRLEDAKRDNALKEEVIDSLAVVIKKLETETSAELEAAERERDDVAQQLVQAEIGKRKLEAECDELLAKIAQMERQEPVEWRTFDGEGGYDYRNFAGNEDYQAVWEARNPNHKGWVEPLYALPGAKGE